MSRATLRGKLNQRPNRAATRSTTPDSTDRGLAELIVAKHRARPTGIVKVAFLPQYTSFENLARPSPTNTF